MEGESERQGRMRGGGEEEGETEQTYHFIP